MVEVLIGGVLVLQVVIVTLLILRHPSSLINSVMDGLRESLSKITELETTLRNYREFNEVLEKSLKEEVRRSREEITSSIHSFIGSITEQFKLFSGIQKEQLESFSRQLVDLVRITENRLEDVRKTVEERLKLLQDENSKRLEEIREIVDKELHSTLEKRLGESFRLVSERLEQVYKGLGEMQALASDVGDLKKVLSNVKTRGVFGEVQLGAILEYILTPDQYVKNFSAKDHSKEKVEYAIKIPNKNGDDFVYLPIDAKFPMEYYNKLIDAYDQGDSKAIEEAGKKLEQKIKELAKDIRDKYIYPPKTTDFAIMFLPTESLYAEVLRRPGLLETLQREFKVTIVGPTTLCAFLNSLQMGFKTLVIEKRSSEIWNLLSAVKTEFVRFRDVLEKAHKKIKEAENVIVEATKKTRTIEDRLSSVQQLPQEESAKLLGFPDDHGSSSN